MSIATGMSGSDEPGRCASARSAIGSVLDHAVNVRIDITGDPDAGAIVEGAGRRVDHEKNGRMNSETRSQSVASALMRNSPASFDCSVFSTIASSSVSKWS